MKEKVDVCHLYNFEVIVLKDRVHSHHGCIPFIPLVTSHFIFETLTLIICLLWWFWVLNTNSFLFTVILVFCI